MSTGIWVAASGAIGQQTALDATANNLANATTAGYRADRALFREHLVSADRAGQARPQMRLSAVDAIAHDLRSGPISATGRALDVAIDGPGFIAVRTPTGEAYTRAGDLRVAADGGIYTAEGHQVLGEAGRPLTVPAGSADLSFDSDGNLHVGGAQVGRLRLVDFPNPLALEKEGHRLFRATEQSGRARVSAIRVEPEALERGNVSVVSGMTEIITTTRGFDAIQRVIEAFREADRRAAMDIMSPR